MIEEKLSRKIIHKLLTSKAFLFSLLLLTIWVALACVKIANKRYRMAREIENIQQEIEQLRKDNQNLSVLINYFNNPSYLEKEAKRRLNLRKEGEEVVILPQNNATTTLTEDNSVLPGGDNKQPAAGDKEKTENREESNFWKWWTYFFK